MNMMKKVFRAVKGKGLCFAAVTAAVVLAAAFSLTVPAAPPETEAYCGYREHTHTEDCCGESGELICQEEEHVHTEECFTEPAAESETAEDAARPDPETVTETAQNASMPAFTEEEPSAESADTDGPNEEKEPAAADSLEEGTEEEPVAEFAAEEEITYGETSAREPVAEIPGTEEPVEVSAEETAGETNTEMPGGKETSAEETEEILPAPDPEIFLSAVMPLFAVPISQDENYIEVRKTFAGEGISPDMIPGNYRIRVTGGNSYTLDLHTPGVQMSDDGLTYVWRINGVGAGTYTVSESNYEIEDYQVMSEGTGTVAVKAAEMDFGEPDIETTCSHPDWPVHGGQFFAGSLTGSLGKGTVILTEYSLSASEREAVTEQLLPMLRNADAGVWKEPVYFFSIEQQSTSFTIAGKTIRYSYENREAVFEDTSMWQHVASVTGNLSDPQNADISITNTYNMGMELPRTGGIGTFRYTLRGMALLAAAAVICSFRWNRIRRKGTLTSTDPGH